MTAETARERLLRLLDANPDPGFAKSDAMLRGWVQGATGGADPPPEPIVYPPCTHCGLEVENRGDPNPFGPWEIRWVHVDGGYSICFPQQGGDSPRAKPAPTDKESTL